jgi:hypothetical protein
VILPQSKASSKLRFRSGQVIESPNLSSWNQIARRLPQFDAVHSSDPAKRQDFWDPIKYIRLRADRNDW